MKYLEQRVEELELEVKLLKAKNKLEKTKEKDYLYNPSINLLSEPELETAFASPWDTSEIKKNPLDTITVKQPDHTDYEYPGYPNIIGSWDSCDWNTSNVPPYPGDEITKNVIDEYGFKMNYEEPITTWGYVSKYDKMDKDFLKNSLELKIEKDFGKIVSKFRILNHEWEMDGYGYIVNNGIDNIIVTTNHGKPIVVDKDYLNIKIREYKETIQETERALYLIK